MVIHVSFRLSVHHPRCAGLHVSSLQGARQSKALVLGVTLSQCALIIALS